MNLCRDNIEKMEGYVPGEQPLGPGFVKLNTNENPYPPSPRVKEAILAEAERVRLYPDPLARDLRALIAELNGLSPENVLVGNGSDDTLTMLTRAFAGENDLVVSPSPTYTLYRTLCEIQGCRYEAVPFRENYSLDPGVIPMETRLVFVCNPNSPSGTTVPEEVLAKIAGRIEGALVVDEAYVDFAEKDCSGLLKGFGNVVLLRSFSKSFSLAGLRVGYALADAGVIANLLKVKDSYNVNRLALAGALTALGDMEWMRANSLRIIATRQRLAKEMEGLGFRVFPSEANFVLARSEGCPAEEIYRRLKEKKILVRHYDTPRLKKCLRVSVGTDAEIDTFLAETAAIIGE